MKNSIRITAAVALAAAATLALPVAAQAATIYPPSNACHILPTVVAPGATAQFSCADGSFSPGETVSITVEGATGAEIGFVKFAVTSSGSATATSSGALAPVSITFPADASGIYNITAVSPTSVGGTATATIGSSGVGNPSPSPSTGTGGTGGTGGTSGTGASSSSGGLAVTGLDSGSLLGLWVGGGALLLTGGALAVAATVRRNRRHAEV